ncbi:hypothetical protein PR202_ga02461 [Eleusine coracana subsp. coracana]|uniref:Uncharacterized protein n=1 Tax=Eleusine coracana subsp. coracana TaxID=191504 RepID=A0AAV5BLN8_ELECO|nr:hypothetical protein PR202_ga02461 [Eleusine coracana subsp. coracana]
MEQNDSMADSPRRRHNLLRDKVQLRKRKDKNRYEIVPFPDPLSFEKGFFVVIRACQLLAQHNDGIIFVGVAGPSGAGKTVFTEKVVNLTPDVAVISMDNYNDATRIIDGNFDDPRLTDYDTLLENIHGLKEGRSVQVPIYDFKMSCRTGYRTVDPPSSRIVIIEGIYALSEKIRPFLDLRVSVTGGVHFDLVKRVLRDIQRAGQEPEEIIHQISETVYPMYKAFIEPDLETAHIKIRNKFNPFTGFQNPMYILKSPRPLTPEKIKAVLGDEHTESNEETYDIYLLPPGEDPEACQSYLRMRNREGKYNLMFEIQGRDRLYVKSVAEQLGLDGSYIPRTYIEQIQLEKLMNDVMALPEDLKTKLSIDDELVSSPKEAFSRVSADRRNQLMKSGLSHSYSTHGDKNIVKLSKLTDSNRRFGGGRAPESSAINQGAITQLSEQITTLNERMDEFTSRVEELNSKFAVKKLSPSQQNLALSNDACNGSTPTNLFVSQLGNGTLIPHSSSSNQLSKESPMTEEIMIISRGQRQVIHQLDNLTSLLHEHLVLTRQANAASKNRLLDMDTAICPLIFLTVGSVAYFMYKSLSRN